MAPTLITTLALVSVFASGTSDNGTQSLSCCGEPQVEFEKGCEFHASANNRAFAWFAPEVLDETNLQCIYPCKHLKDGLMTLERCTNVSINVVCTKNGMVVSDVEQDYIEQPCNVTVAPWPDVLLVLMVLCCIRGR